MSNPGPAITTVEPLQNLSSNQAIRLLAFKKAVNLNSVGDTPLKIISATTYSVKDVLLANVNLSLTAATGGMFTQISGSGTAIVSTAALSANTGPTIVTEESVASTAAQTVQTLYWRVAVVNGNAATGDVYVYGYDLS